MGQILFSNNARTTLATGCASGDTTLNVTSSSTFPAPTTASGNWFYACLQDAFANLEIVKVTNVTGSAWTVTRAIGGTTALAFVAGSVVELRATAETFSDVYNYTVSGALQNSTPQYLTSVSGTNTILASLTPALTAYAAGQKFHFVAVGANTGATTININSLGAIAITKQGSVALVGGEIVAGAAYILINDGTHFQLSGGVGSNSGVNSLTQSTGVNVLAGTGQVLVGPITIPSGQQFTIASGARAVII